MLYYPHMFTFLNNTIKKFRWNDIAAIKLNMFFFTLFLFGVWKGFRIFIHSVEWYWWLILSIVVVIPSLRKVFGGK